MNLTDSKNSRLVRRLAGVLAVSIYGVVMALTANHAITQADPVPQRTWKPTAKALANQPTNHAGAAHRPSLRMAELASTQETPNTTQLRKAYLLFGSTMLGTNPIDAARHPWPHTGEFIDDCSTTMASDGPQLLSM